MLVLESQIAIYSMRDIYSSCRRTTISCIEVGKHGSNVVCLDAELVGSYCPQDSHTAEYV